MSCFHPLEAFANPKGGKPFFSRPSGHSGRVLSLPCGQCIGCRLDRCCDWSARITHEALFWESNWFLTWTFGDGHYPPDGCVRREVIQDSFKRLRERAKRRGLLEGPGLRKFYNAEYGSQTQRAHYHAIVFGLKLPDLVVWKNNERGERLWTSAFLDEAWGFGRVMVGAVTPTSAAYVAGYCLRDTSAKHSPYGFVDVDTGEFRERVAPFVGMSRRPGIGRGFFDKFRGDVFPRDFALIEGRKVPTPKYYRRLLETANPVLAAELKAKREASVYSPESKRERRPARLAVREVCKVAQVGSGKRGSRGGGL